MALHRVIVLATGVLLFFCKYGAVPSALGASSFAPLPRQSTFTLTNPVILVSPTRLDFVLVPPHKGATNTFLVENVGPGKLVGTASAPPPFKILSGGSYALREHEVQVVTVAYTPGRVRANTAKVTFTGGGGAKAIVSGRR